MSQIHMCIVPCNVLVSHTESFSDPHQVEVVSKKIFVGVHYFKHSFADVRRNVMKNNDKSLQLVNPKIMDCILTLCSYSWATKLLVCFF